MSVSKKQKKRCTNNLQCLILGPGTCIWNTAIGSPSLYAILWKEFPFSEQKVKTTYNPRSVAKACSFPEAGISLCLLMPTKNHLS